MSKKIIFIVLLLCVVIFVKNILVKRNFNNNLPLSTSPKLSKEAYDSLQEVLLTDDSDFIPNTL